MDAVNVMDSSQLPSPGPVADACRAATGHNYGDTLVGGPVLTAAGIRVRMSSWPRQQEALKMLRLLGYQAAEDSREGEHGAALIVTGWDTDLLTARAERLEDAAGRIRRDLPVWADAAVTRFMNLQDAEGWDDSVALEQAVIESRRAARDEPGPAFRHASAAVDERDRARASGQVRVLLDRVAAAETAAAGMTGAAAGIAETAIGLFLEYRGLHGCGRNEAAENAIRDITLDAQDAAAGKKSGFG